MTTVSLRRTAPAVPLSAVLAGLTVLAQIAYPLTSGRALNDLTITTVLLFAAATLTHLAVTRGQRDCLLFLIISAGIGFAAEAVGVHTGLPFGSYHYTGTLGAEVLGVPLVVPLAWSMLAWPTLCAARRIGRPVLAGAVALAGWDLFLDPQMVHDGHWVWTGGGPRLSGIPLTNTLGWLVVAAVLMAVLDKALPEHPMPEHQLPEHRQPDAVPLALWLWTWSSSVLANLAFFDRPLVALAGGVGMGLAGVPLLRRLARP